MVVALGIRVPVEGFGVIHDQGVEEHMGDLVYIRPDECGFCLLAGGDKFLHIGILRVIRVGV